MKKTLIINLYAGPGAGKTTLAHSLFSDMKKEGMNVGFASEYAQERILRNYPMDDQYLISTEQIHRIKILYGKVDYIVTDCPILLGVIYLNDFKIENVNENVFLKQKSFFRNFLIQTNNLFKNNYNLFIERKLGNFQQFGRLHNEEESVILDNKIKEMLKAQRQKFITVNHNTTNNEIISNIKMEFLKC